MLTLMTALVSCTPEALDPATDIDTSNNWRTASASSSTSARGRSRIVSSTAVERSTSVTSYWSLSCQEPHRISLSPTSRKSRLTSVKSRSASAFAIDRRSASFSTSMAMRSPNRLRFEIASAADSRSHHLYQKSDLARPPTSPPLVKGNHVIRPVIERPPATHDRRDVPPPCDDRKGGIPSHDSAPRIEGIPDDRRTCFLSATPRVFSVRPARRSVACGPCRVSARAASAGSRPSRDPRLRAG